MKFSDGKQHKFQTPLAGRWVLQPGPRQKGDSPRGPVSNPISGEVGAAALCLGPRGPDRSGVVSNPISGEVGAAAVKKADNTLTAKEKFQTPSAGRWVLQHTSATPSGLLSARFKPHQRGGGCCSGPCLRRSPGRSACFKPHQRGGGCCSAEEFMLNRKIKALFQTPSAGRWVLQRAGSCFLSKQERRFQTPSAGRWVLQHRQVESESCSHCWLFQTPSAGRWVLQRSCRSSLTNTPGSFKPHQRGGGCCSLDRRPHPWGCLAVSNPISGEVGAAAPPHRHLHGTPGHVSNPISGEVGAAALEDLNDLYNQASRFQTPSAGRWVLQHAFL